MWKLICVNNSDAGIMTFKRNLLKRIQLLLMTGLGLVCKYLWLE